MTYDSDTQARMLVAYILIAIGLFLMTWGTFTGGLTNEIGGTEGTLFGGFLFLGGIILTLKD